MSLKRFRTILIAIACLACIFSAQAEIPRKPQGRVSDFAKILTPEAIAEITGLLERVENSTGAQIAVVTVTSLGDLSVEEYANQLFNQWGIGQKNENNGVLLLVAHEERKVKIEVGYGLEQVLTDAGAGRILDQSVVPFFKSGDYGQGILHGCERISALITGEDSTVFSPSEIGGTGNQESATGWVEKIGILAFFGLFVTLGFIALGTGLRGQKFFIVWGAGFGGIPLAMSIVFALAIGFPVYILPIWALIMLVTGLFLGKKLTKAMEKSGSGSRSRHSSRSSSSFSGGFSSGSSFSSFGGGSSGGGGAGRSW